jgi:hypothetical protein
MRCEEPMIIEGALRIRVTSWNRIEAAISRRCGILIDFATPPAICRDHPAHPPNLTVVARAALALSDPMEPGESVLGPTLRGHKYGRNQALEPALAERLGRPLPGAMGKYDLVVPTPLNPERPPRRRFNQAARLGTVVAKKFGCRFEMGSLVRAKSTLPPTGFGHHQRQRNLGRPFGTRPAKSIVGRNLVVVDDLMTGSATLEQCARARREASARAGDALARARAQ